MAAALLLGGLAVAGLFLAADAGPTPQLLSLSVFGLGLGASIAVPRTPSKCRKPLISLRFWRSGGVPPPASPPAMKHG